MEKGENCINCSKIKCKGCGWEPDDTELLKIINREITMCPVCGWQPS